LFKRFTARARRVVVLAQEEARSLGHHHLGSEHILLGLIRAGEGLAVETLRKLDIDPDDLRRRAETVTGRGDSPSSERLPFTPAAKEVLELSLREALWLGHDHIGTEHILLGLIREGGLTAEVLGEHGHDLMEVRVEVLKALARPVDVPGAGDAEFRVRPSARGLAERLDRLIGTVERIERRLDALGAPADPQAADPHPDDTAPQGTGPGDTAAAAAGGAEETGPGETAGEG
jgi:ATP-dependent Clp protease ATP-binding subunit ClpC